jgi:N-acetylglutamate synthase-like GNAT family acetyltransferase
MAHDTFETDMFHPSDAEGVAELFRTVYGDGYPVKLVYNPEELTAAFSAKENIPVVARTATGKIIGYCGIYRSSPNPNLYEAGQGLVNPEYRGSGVNTEILVYIMDKLSIELGIHALFGEAVCNHVYMQKTCCNVGYIETGIEVDLMPAEAYAKEKSASGRVAAMPVFRIYKPEEQTVYLPAGYKDYLHYLYEGLDIPRFFAVSDENTKPEGKTEQNTQIFDFAGVARVAFSHAGADFEGVLNGLEKDLLGRSMSVIQFWLKLDAPWISNITGFLRKSGYFFGGLLPGWFGTDAILMQKIVEKPNWEGITLYSDRAKKILEMVRGDWEAIKE